MRHLLLPKLIVVALAALGVSACAALEGLRGLVQAPRFEQAPGQPAEIRVVGPSATQPLGGAGVRLWTQVTNPNAFSLTLGTLRGTLHIEDARAADVDFPLGLPLRASEHTVIPIDLSISFSDLPGLADVVRRAASRQPLAYHLEGTIGVNAGQLGQPTFGPMTLLRGELRGIQ
ncbi:MAG TPA: LEA type 2 family protein [Vicinamibacterales bacterium]|nr:LEA type 2 family protein [Vicinamibacterales bacterium]